jgi:hypothetical protein
VFLGSSARGAVRDSLIEKCRLDGILVRDGASPAVEANRLLSNGQWGAELIDCRATYVGNEAKGNKNGGLTGECDAPDGNA